MAADADVGFRTDEPDRAGAIGLKNIRFRLEERNSQLYWMLRGKTLE